MNTPDLILAAQADDLEGLCHLLNIGADPDTVEFSGLRAGALHYTVEFVTGQATALLLEAGANPNLPDGDGLTPVHWAAIGGSLVALRFLLQHGGSPHIAALDGRTPLQLATGLQLRLLQKYTRRPPLRAVPHPLGQITTLARQNSVPHTGIPPMPPTLRNTPFAVPARSQNKPQQYPL